MSPLPDFWCDESCVTWTRCCRDTNCCNKSSWQLINHQSLSCTVETGTQFSRAKRCKTIQGKGVRQLLVWGFFGLLYSGFSATLCIFPQNMTSFFSRLGNLLLQGLPWLHSSDDLITHLPQSCNWNSAQLQLSRPVWGLGEVPLFGQLGPKEFLPLKPNWSRACTFKKKYYSTGKAPLQQVFLGSPCHTFKVCLLDSYCGTGTVWMGRVY